MREKKFHIQAEDIKPLVQYPGGCIATDRITVDGQRVGYMYREPPDHDADSGWRFLAGDETDEYMDDADNHGIYAVNTIANYDEDIVPFLNAPAGSKFARNCETGILEPIIGPVDPDACLHPDFPVVTGDHQLSAEWAVSLPHKFNRRVEDGSLILWRPGITIYITAWNNDNSDLINTRLSHLKESISQDAFDPREEEDGTVERFSYRLTEDAQEALYGFVVAENGHLQIAIYFDDESDIALANSIFSSFTYSAG